MSFIYNMADTWNAVGTTFNAILMNVSNGAGGAAVGAAASRMLNLQNNGLPLLTLDAAGQVIVNRNASSSFVTALVPGLQIFGANAEFPGIELYSFASSGTFLFRRGNTSLAAPTNLVSGNVIGAVGWAGYDGTSWSGNAAFISGTVEVSDWTNTSHPARLEFRTCPAGSTTPVTRLILDSNGSVVLNTAAIATTATDGFMYIATCAGTPTGVPTGYTGRVPMVFDTSNSQFWVYTAGAWKQPKTPAAAALITWQ